MVNELLRQRNKVEGTQRWETIYLGINKEDRSIMIDIYSDTPIVIELCSNGSWNKDGRWGFEHT